MRYIYAIFDETHVLMWDTVNPNEGDIPFFSQPVHPDGRAWNSREEAEAWAEAFIAELEAPEVPTE